MENAGFHPLDWIVFIVYLPGRSEHVLLRELRDHDADRLRR